MALSITNNKICPFGQRLWLTLELSGLPYTFKETSLAPGTKPEWFTALYKSALGADSASDGKVPILEHGDFVLTESAHCADYVAALAPPEKRLLPATPAERARTGLFVEAIGKYVGPFYALLMKQDAAEQATARAALIAAMHGLAAHLARLGGPFLLGDRVSLGDVLLWPFVERLCVVEHYRAFALEQVAAGDAALAPFMAWRSAMLALPAVAATAQPAAFFIAGYEPYASGKK